MSYWEKLKDIKNKLSKIERKLIELSDSENVTFQEVISDLDILIISDHGECVDKAVIGIYEV